MRKICAVLSIASFFAVAGAAEAADKYAKTIAVFKHSAGSAAYFRHCYGYAVFPTVFEHVIVVGGALGKGRVFVHHRLVGSTWMTKVSAGLQAGGKTFSQIIFFRDRKALDTFESGSFQFAADANVTAVTASAGAFAGTAGSGANVSGTAHNAATVGSGYKDGMAVFTITKHGLMYAAAIGGQAFSYKPRGVR
jgi:lipid-binding SYLF domain-containing protein